MEAHDAVMKARVKQTVGANKKRRACPFVKGDLVYISKFIGPYKISDDFGNNSFRVELPDNLKQRGVHNVFHSSLLRVHVPNDDRKFPGRRDDQIPELGGETHEWAVERIVRHRGSHSDATFEVQWTPGDRTWLPGYGQRGHVR